MVDRLNLYGMVGNDPLSLRDYLGLAAGEIVARLDRKQTGYFAVYGELDISIEDGKTEQCCGFPLKVKTLERPPGADNTTLPYRLGGTYFGSLRPGDSGAKGDNDTSPQGIAPANIPQKPEEIMEADWARAKVSEWNTGNGGVNVHMGLISSWSGGCPLVGSQYTAVRAQFKGYANVNPDLFYGSSLFCVGKGGR